MFAGGRPVVLALIYTLYALICKWRSLLGLPRTPPLGSLPSIQSPSPSARSVVLSPRARPAPWPGGSPSAALYPIDCHNPHLPQDYHNYHHAIRSALAPSFRSFPCLPNLPRRGPPPLEPPGIRFPSYQRRGSPRVCRPSQRGSMASFQEERTSRPSPMGNLPWQTDAGLVRRGLALETCSTHQHPPGEVVHRRAAQELGYRTMHFSPVQVLIPVISD
ncbi:hypothetical protein LXA43DRAFT_490872 [Ganoderma leucocontextum]|nr:hypothetical protein LXA43DRAFT_490872 [Ganoderma leucocontextum]